MQDISSPASTCSGLARLFADPALCPRRLTLAAGDVLYHPDSPADNVYFLHRGQVRLYQLGSHDSRLIEILGPDAWFGVGALARSRTHENRAVAVVPTIVSEVRADRFLAAIARKPDTLLELTHELARKLQQSREDAARLVFEDCNSRLIRALIQFSHSAASTPREDGVVLRITHNQLAQAIGVARETVSLALTQLRQQNLLKTGRNQLFFNPEALRKFRIPTRNGAAEPAHTTAQAQLA